MDTQTVLDIIKMIDNKVLDMAIDVEADKISEEHFNIGALELLEFQKHLQEYIEDQLNAVENSTPE